MHENRMLLEERVKPVNDDHSIEEVVLTIFSGEAIDLDAFSRISAPNIPNVTVKKEDAILTKLSLNNKKDSFEKTDPEKIGARYIVEDENGKIIKLIQGLNEDSRAFISYHSLNYTRWASFLDEFGQFINVVLDTFGKFSVAAFSLHYIDKFNWLDESKINPRIIFDIDSKYIPREFFNVVGGSFNITTEKLFEENVCYDRIEVKTDNDNKTIFISHNLTRVLTKPTDLSDLIHSDNFNKILQWAHIQNKLFLSDILDESIAQLIKLNRSTNQNEVV